MGITAVRSRSTRLVASTAVAAVLGLLACNATAGFSSITVFGDSLSDGGNDYLLTNHLVPPPPYDQRFTNGPTAVEVLAADLGLPLTPSLAGGSNYAYGGAQTGANNYLSISPSIPAQLQAAFGPGTGILPQVQGFVPPAGFGGPQSLVVLWGGPNDLFAGQQTGQAPAQIIATAMTNIATSVGLLYADGARTLLLPDMPDVGNTPLGLSSGNGPALTAFAVAFDSALQQTIAQLSQGHPGLDIIPFSTFNLLSSVLAKPSTYGFADTTHACFNGVTVCSDPNAFLFWDQDHPSAHAHAIIGDAFAAAVLAAVPEPGPLALFALGCAMLFAWQAPGRLVLLRIRPGATQ